MTVKNRDDEYVEIDPDQLDLLSDKDGTKPDKDVHVEAKKEDRPERKTDEEIEALKQRLESLQAERDAERRERDQERERANEEARALAAKVVRATDSANQSRYDQVNEALNASKERQAAIKRDIRLAYESGDSERVADLQIEAASVAVKIQRGEENKFAMERQAEQERARREAEPPPQQTRRSSDPFEDQIASLSDPTKNWLRNHKECITDPEKNAQVMLEHHRAVKKGLRPDSAEYFQELEEAMGYRRRSEPDTSEIDVSDEGQRSSTRMPAAPVSRDVPRSGGAINGRVRLTRAEVETAGDLGMTPAEYAKYKMALEKDPDHRLNHPTH